MSGGWGRPSSVQVQRLPTHACSDTPGLRAAAELMGLGEQVPGHMLTVGPLCTQAAWGWGGGLTRGVGRYADEGTQGGGVRWGRGKSC